MELQGLDKERVIRGYQNKTKGLEISDSLIDLANHIADICSEKEIVFPNMGKRQACLEGKRFLIENFNLHQVKYRSMEDLDAFCRQEHTQQEIKEYFQNIEKISPFQLPVAFYKSPFDNQVIETFPSVEDEELLDQLEIIFSGIVLEKNSTLLTPHHYIHEIVHTQLDGRRGTIQNSFNREVLSIFLELVSLSEKSDEKMLHYVIEEYYRKLNSYIWVLVDFMQNKDSEFDAKDYEEYSIYIVSTLKGLNLFRKYQECPILKRSILKGVQSVFNNLEPLEELLKFCEVSTTEEMDYIMKL